MIWLPDPKRLVRREGWVGGVVCASPLRLG